MVRSRGTRRVMSIRQVIASDLGIPEEGSRIEIIVMALTSPCLLMTASSPDVVREIYPSLISTKGKQNAVDQLLQMIVALKKQMSEQDQTEEKPQV